MIYPLFVLLIVIGVVSVMMLMVIPKLLDIFEDKTDLPVSTKILMNISDAFSNYWYIILLV